MPAPLVMRSGAGVMYVWRCAQQASASNVHCQIEDAGCRLLLPGWVPPAIPQAVTEEVQTKPRKAEPAKEDVKKDEVQDGGQGDEKTERKLEVHEVGGNPLAGILGGYGGDGEGDDDSSGSSDDDKEVVVPPGTSFF